MLTGRECLDEHLEEIRQDRADGEDTSVDVSLRLCPWL